MLEGLEWGTTEAVDKLKKMLWGLEALRVFDDRLSASLAQIQKAREAMERTIKQVNQGPRCVDSTSNITLGSWTAARGSS